eukprot:1404972-Pleurochrysis_carterae.AAC.1
MGEREGKGMGRAREGERRRAKESKGERRRAKEREGERRRAKKKSSKRGREGVREKRRREGVTDRLRRRRSRAVAGRVPGAVPRPEIHVTSRAVRGADNPSTVGLPKLLPAMAGYGRYASLRREGPKELCDGCTLAAIAKHGESGLK